VTLDERRMRDLVGASRVAHFATTSADGRPHVVPICFAVADDVLWSAIDAKPKGPGPLRRVRSVMENPRAAALVDRYSDDWLGLWWVRLDGRARIVEANEPEGVRAIAALAERYAQYRETPPPGPVLALDIERWSGWQGE
jgi:PPOX class probable F420-dependent enzyme